MSCKDSACLKILLQKEDKKDYVRQFNHVFNSKNIDCGDAYFIDLEVSFLLAIKFLAIVKRKISTRN